LFTAFLATAILQKIGEFAFAANDWGTWRRRTREIYATYATFWRTSLTNRIGAQKKLRFATCTNISVCCWTRDAIFNLSYAIREEKRNLIEKKEKEDHFCVWFGF
jgi:hypothetical protein